MTTTEKEQTESTRLVNIFNFYSPTNIESLNDIRDMGLEHASATLKSMLDEGTSTGLSRKVARMLEQEYPNIRESLPEDYRQNLKIYMNS